MLGALVLVTLVAATPAPATGPAAVRIVSQQARWEGLGAPDELGPERAEMFLISGELRNDGSASLASVHLVYELLAAGVVVASEHGYNRRAEALRDPAVESGAVGRDALAIAPLRPGDSDLFRMVFLRGAVPRFDQWRVRIEATAPATTPDTATP